MGKYIFDQYSLLHLCVGVIFYFWNFSLYSSIIIHIIFEVIENTTFGMFMINKFIIEKGWFSYPGEKHYADSVMNIMGDNISFLFGWLLGYITDYYGNKYKLFI